ncbi:hypothetical protein PIB30_050770 [Stylosanthes scabra]|uniref:Uncharacterized protein n=1 Tax=Stylosanthes scabra TaxID=79078 RepID=A0ABU6WHB1_9FABA|nr:hypothetical protein [Stylosanthes scabra]
MQAKELNREPTLAKVFKQTHTRKRNKEEWSAHEGNDSNNPVVVDPDEVWRDVVGEPRKNHIYGVGSYFSRTLRTDPLLRSSRGTSEPPLSKHTVAELKMNATVERAHDELVRKREELLREREEYRKMREEMAAYYASIRATGSAVGSTTVTAPAAQHDGDGGQEEEQEEEDDADDYQDP